MAFSGEFKEHVWIALVEAKRRQPKCKKKMNKIRGIREGVSANVEDIIPISKSAQLSTYSGESTHDSQSC